jgi:diaminohydroxyphosphoribosylaminopyrimidine deaminase/5-amino-6-(5-phosphoribosylamino)uracil reductase
MREPGGETLVAVTRSAPLARRRRLAAAGARILETEEASGRVSLPALVRELGRLGVTSILIEGGGEIAASALFDGIVDKLLLFVAPKIVGGRTAVTAVEGTGVSTLAEALPVRDLKASRVGPDLLIQAYTCSQESSKK